MLPTNIELTDEDIDKVLSGDTLERISEEINDYLADKYGYCTEGYGYEIKINIDQITWNTED